MLKGSLVAIVSPMHEDGTLDLDAFRRLVDWHIAEGTAPNLLSRRGLPDSSSTFESVFALSAA